MKETQRSKTTSFLAQGTVLKGKLRVKGGLRIDGVLTGSLHSESIVLVGDTARIDADIEAQSLISSGKVAGDVRAVEQVQVNLPGSIKGNIETRELTLEQGVFFEGSCTMLETKK